MNERIFTPLVGAVIGWISFETLQSVLYSILLAFLGGIAAWAGKKMCEKFEKWWQKKEAENEEGI